MIGWKRSRSAFWTSGCPLSVGSKPARRSAPERDARPLPVRTTARTSSSSRRRERREQVVAELGVDGVHRLRAVEHDRGDGAAALDSGRSSAGSFV